MSNDIDLTELSGRRYSWFSAMYQSTSFKSPDLGPGTGMFGEKVNSGKPLILNTSEVKKKGYLG